jgi:hypothetical protein
LLVVDSGDSTIRYGSASAELLPQIITQPIRGATIPVGSDLTLGVEVQSTASVTYQWFANGRPIAGATSSQLHLQNLKETDSGEYRVAVSDAPAYVLSFPAKVQVLATTPKSNAPMDNWSRIAASPLQDIHGLAYGNGRYVTVGGGISWSSASYSGSVATSTDGEHWVKQFPIASEALNAVGFGAGKFVVVGNKATVLTSRDGLDWQPQTLSTQGMPDLNGITFAQGIFVAVSGDVHGSIWTSHDGIHWTNRGLDFGVSLMAVGASGGQVVALGNTVLTSTNGFDWAPAQVPANFVGQQVLLEHIAGGSANVRRRPPGPVPLGTVLQHAPGYSGSKLLVSEHYAGSLAASPDGLDWHDAAPTNGLSLCQITYGNGLFLAVDASSGGVTVSKDGRQWTSPVLVSNRQRSISSPHLRFDQGLFLASGYEGALFTSTDGTNWSCFQQESAIPFAPTSLVRVGEQYWAGGWDGGLAVSSNGSDWNLVLPTNSFPGLAYGGGTLIAAGANDVIVSSLDGGETWTDRSPHFNYGAISLSLYRLIYGGGVFVALGSLSYYDGSQQVQLSHVLTSSNGVNWIQSNLDRRNYFINEIAYGAGVFVAIQAPNQSGADCQILVSTNGIAWKTVSAHPTNWPSAIAFGNERFVIGTGSGAVLISADGMSWSQYPALGNYSFSKLVFGNGFFLASVWPPDGSSPRLLSSIDGLTWTQRPAPIGNFSIVAATEGAFFISGEDSSLYQSAPFQWLGDPRWLSPAQLEWTVAGAPRSNYRLEFSEDLRVWQTFTHITNAPAMGTFIDPTAGRSPARFYRTVTE